MEKSKYIAKIIPFMKEHGMSLSMDAIAEGIGVSKKTLYNQFSSKEELLEAILASTTDEFHKKVDCLSNYDCPVINGFKSGITGLKEYFYDISHLFMKDFIRLNPTKSSAHHIMGSDYFERQMKENIIRGKQEGVYRDDIDENLFSKYIASSIFGFFYRNVMARKDYAADYYFSQVTEFNLRALVKHQA